MLSEMKVMTAFIWKLEVTLPQRAAMTNLFRNPGSAELQQSLFYIVAGLLTHGRCTTSVTTTVGRADATVLTGRLKGREVCGKVQRP